MGSHNLYGYTLTYDDVVNRQWWEEIASAEIPLATVGVNTPPPAVEVILAHQAIIQAALRVLSYANHRAHITGAEPTPEWWIGTLNYATMMLTGCSTHNDDIKVSLVLPGRHTDMSAEAFVKEIQRRFFAEAYKIALGC